MSSSERIALLALCLALNPLPAAAAGYVLGVGGEADNADGRAVTAFGDFGVGENTWLSAAAGMSRTESAFGGFEPVFGDLGIDHWFKPLGVRVAAGYWGDSELLDSADVRGAVYYRDENASLSLDYEHRQFDFIFRTLLLDEQREVEFFANGWGMSTRFTMSDNISVFLNGMQYEYSRDISIEPRVDLLNILSFSRLSVMNSLLDYRVSGGFEYRFGLKSVDVAAASWKTAVDQGRVDSYSIGLLMPLTDRTDIELRFGYDTSEVYGEALVLSAYLYYFGGN